MAEEIAVKVIAGSTRISEKFKIPRQSGLIEELKSTIVFEPEFRDAGAARHRGIFPSLVNLGVFRGCARHLVTDGAAAAAWRKQAGRCICNALSVPAQSDRAFFGKAGACGAASALGPVLHLSGADLMDGTPIPWTSNRICRMWTAMRRHLAALRKRRRSHLFPLKFRMSCWKNSGGLPRH